MIMLDDLQKCKGKIAKSITLGQSEDGENNSLTFTFSDGYRLKLYHEQDCCESVCINDIVGDLDDLIGNPLLIAEERTSSGLLSEDDDPSFTWTFYEFATIRGSVTIRFYGESRGFYSESVTAKLIPAGEDDE